MRETQQQSDENGPAPGDDNVGGADRGGEFMPEDSALAAVKAGHALGESLPMTLDYAREMLPDDIQYAGIWRRFFSMYINFFGMIFVTTGLYFLAAEAGIWAFLPGYVADSYAILLFLFLFFWTLVSCCCLRGGWQASPGKRVCGVYVTDTRFRRISLKQAILRFWTPIVLLLGPPLIGASLSSVAYIPGMILAYLGPGLVLGDYLLAAFRRDKATLHDLVAGTRVLKGSPDE